MRINRHSPVHFRLEVQEKDYLHALLQLLASSLDFGKERNVWHLEGAAQTRPG